MELFLHLDRLQKDSCQVESPLTELNCSEVGKKLVGNLSEKYLIRMDTVTHDCLNILIHYNVLINAFKISLIETYGLKLSNFLKIESNNIIFLSCD